MGGLGGVAVVYTVAFGIPKRRTPALPNCYGVHSLMSEYIVGLIRASHRLDPTAIVRNDDLIYAQNKYLGVVHSTQEKVPF